MLLLLHWRLLRRRKRHRSRILKARIIVESRVARKDCRGLKIGLEGLLIRSEAGWLLEARMLLLLMLLLLLLLLHKFQLGSLQGVEEKRLL